MEAPPPLWFQFQIMAPMHYEKVAIGLYTALPPPLNSFGPPLTPPPPSPGAAWLWPVYIDYLWGDLGHDLPVIILP